MQQISWLALAGALALLAGAQASLEAADRAQEESLDRVYEQVARLVQSANQGALAGARRLVGRLDRLVGGAQQSLELRTEQLLDRLEQLAPRPEGGQMAQLNEELAGLVGALGESYLRNMRRLVDRANRVLGRPGAQHQDSDRLEDVSQRLPGFPGWDELIVAMDRMQKSLAHFVRSGTRFITSG